MSERSKLKLVPDNTARGSESLLTERNLVFWAAKQRTGSPIRGYILVLIADFYSIQKGHAWCSVQRLADEAGVTPQTVRTHINELERRGYILIKRRRKEDGSHASHQYRFNHIEGRREPVDKSGGGG